MQFKYKKGFQKIEQLTASGKIILGEDYSISSESQIEIFMNIFGNDMVELRSIKVKESFKDVIVIKSLEKEYMILSKNISYLGIPHAKYKKRIQLPTYYKDIVEEYKDQYDIRFIGVYYREDVLILVDFEKDTYIQRKSNNSSAHVLVVDLFHAQDKGVYEKKDYNKNTLFLVRSDKFKNYLFGKMKENPNEFMFDVFKGINKGFPFNKRLTALETVKVMFNSGDSNWNQAEWPGFFVEHYYKKEIEAQYLTPKIKFQVNKKKQNDLNHALDFDLLLPKLNIYGDLKASSTDTKEVACNDKKSMEDAVELFGRIWYVIYEHDTEKDTKENHYSEVMKVNQLKNELVGKELKDLLSYKTRMKIAVNFKKMYIVELNKANISHITEVFKQGKNSNGHKREDKLKFKKSLIDNYIIYQYESGDVK